MGFLDKTNPKILNLYPERDVNAPIWGRGFGWAIALLIIAILFTGYVLRRGQSLPQLPQPTQLPKDFI
jgi:hypothetical protein